MDMLFTPDGNYLITGSRDKTAKIWDTTFTTLNVDDWVLGVGVDPRNMIRFLHSVEIAIFMLIVLRLVDMLMGLQPV